MMTNAEIKNAAFENGRNGRKWEERHYLYHKGFLETRGELFHNLRRAKMDAYMFDHYTVEVSDFDLLVGRYSLNYTMTDEERAEVADAQHIIHAAGDFIAGAKRHPQVTVSSIMNCFCRKVWRGFLPVCRKSARHCRYTTR